MASYIARRLAWLPLHLLLVTFFTFSIARFGPGDPVSVAAGQFRDPQVLERVRAERGLDGSLVEQYVRWVNRAVRGDFGQSFLQQGYSVGELIRGKILVSAQLGFISLLIVFGLGIPLGLLAARASGSWIDPLVISVLLFMQALPVLVVIPPLLWLFALRLDILPTGGWDGLVDIYWIRGVVAVPIPDPHLYLPLFVLSLPGFASIARLVRVTALEVLREDYVRTARAKGLSEYTVALKHVLPNSLLPIVTVIGFALTGILGGAFFTETLLGIPGIGRFTFEAVRSRDYDVILALTVIVSAAFVLVNLVAEIAYAFIDPRVRLGAESTT
ncbi:MAG: ABC transporter permease [Dehalococcoidia bacterium]|nr:ABC transporter permease [Dehalococcoidia bacterium]